jgi:hypothetical protein
VVARIDLDFPRWTPTFWIALPLPQLGRALNCVPDDRINTPASTEHHWFFRGCIKYHRRNSSSHARTIHNYIVFPIEGDGN